MILFFNKWIFYLMVSLEIVALVLTGLSIRLIWFPIISLIITQQFPLNSSLIIALDRTQWQDKNIFILNKILSRHYRKTSIKVSVRVTKPVS